MNESSKATANIKHGETGYYTKYPDLSSRRVFMVHYDLTEEGLFDLLEELELENDEEERLFLIYGYLSMAQREVYLHEAIEMLTLKPSTNYT